MYCTLQTQRLRFPRSALTKSRGGKSVTPISLSFFYGLGTVLRPVANLRAGLKLSDVWSELYQAQTDLYGLLSTDWFAPAVKIAATRGWELHAALKAITDRTDFEAEITHIEAFNVTSALGDFQTILRGELNQTHTYYVTQKAGYETGILVSNSEGHFPASLPTKVPDAVVDIRAAGRCLAFELPTASGFHMFRALETVLRKYWDSVTSGKQPPSLKTIGAYVQELDNLKAGDVRTREVLKQLGKLHRNPLSHDSSITLSMEEAIGIFGMGYSCTAAMLNEIVPPPPAASVLMQPPHGPTSPTASSPPSSTSP